VTIGPGHYAVLSAIVFSLGLFGMLSRENAMHVLLAVSLMLLAPVIALAGFAHIGTGGAPPVGDALALMAVVAAAAELVAGVGLCMLVWRRFGNLDARELGDLGDAGGVD
jgi:NADH:ubiquinone oxidoreductase subunit K